MGFKVGVYAIHKPTNSNKANKFYLDKSMRSSSILIALLGAKIDTD